MKNSKGQAALEFMMTYGWAILVVLAAIGALSYFGILNPARFTPDTCLASSGFACPGKPIVTDANLTFSLVNGLGYAVTLRNDTANLSLSNLNCTGRNICTQGTQCLTTGSQLIQDGAGATVVFSGCNFAGASVAKGEARFTYVNPNSQLPETLIVSLTAKPK